MRSYRKELWFQTATRMAFVNITDEIAECGRASGVSEGLCLVNAMHITASVFINDDEPGLREDYPRWLERLAPHEPVQSYHDWRLQGETAASRPPPRLWPIFHPRDPRG